MIAVKVLGPGCINCERLEQHTRSAIAGLATEYPQASVEIEKVTDPARFIDYGVLKTRGLVIGEKLVASGRIPSEQEVTSWLREALYESQIQAES